ncbi:hypothetical protein ABG067_007956, partial [Albugo candida]
MNLNRKLSSHLQKTSLKHHFHVKYGRDVSKGSNFFILQKALHTTQEMKYHHLKAYGLAVIGVFHAYAPFLSGNFVRLVEVSSTKPGSMSARITELKLHSNSDWVKHIGLDVEISPALAFMNDGILENPQSTKSLYYYLNLKIDRVKSTIRESGKKEEKNMNEKCYVEEVLDGRTYCTGWKLTWDYLVELTDNGKLHHFPSTSMDVDFYMSKYSGSYFIKATKSQGHYLHLIQYKEQGPNMEIKASEFSFEVPNLVFFERPHNGQI